MVKPLMIVIRAAITWGVTARGPRLAVRPVILGQPDALFPFRFIETIF
jgi:hypothetical protein